MEFVRALPANKKAVEPLLKNYECNSNQNLECFCCFCIYIYIYIYIPMYFCDRFLKNLATRLIISFGAMEHFVYLKVVAMYQIFRYVDRIFFHIGYCDALVFIFSCKK